MSQTSNEAIWDFYKYIIGLSDNDYYTICKHMRDKEPMPGMAEKIICKADKKRKKIAEYARNKGS